MLFFTLAPRHALPVRSSAECGQWPSTVGPAPLVKEPLGIFCRARRRADKTLSRSKSASFTSAAPYQLRFKGPQSRCFSREWLYGFELCFQTPWLIISQPLEMFALYWQLAQREVGGGGSYLTSGPVNMPDYLVIAGHVWRQVPTVELLARCHLSHLCCVQIFPLGFDKTR